MKRTDWPSVFLAVAFVTLFYSIALLLTGCAPSKKLMKKCEAITPPYSLCEEL